MAHATSSGHIRKPGSDTPDSLSDNLGQQLTGHKMPKLVGMAYDTELADRIRFLIGTGPGVTEKKMFGGLAFLVGDNDQRQRPRWCPGPGRPRR